MRVPLVYRERSVFGFDLGTRTAKLMQLKPVGKQMKVLGYGSMEFPEDAIVEGIIVDPKEILKALPPLLKQMGYGKVTTHRVVASLPVSKVFTRVLRLPVMNQTDLGAAVRLETEQYVPAPLPDLYIDYEVIEQQKDFMEVLMVAAPRAIVDSYLKLFDLAGWEVAVLEPSLTAVTRAVMEAAEVDEVTLVADIGSETIDLAIYDKVIRSTSTVDLGGDAFTNQLVADLKITREQAGTIKVRFGIGPSGMQTKVMASLQRPLETVCGEMRRVMKFYQDRSDQKRTVKRVLLSGGSASMPGLREFLNEQLGVKVDIADAWNGLGLQHMQGAGKREAPMYTTAIGLARLEAHKDRVFP